MEQKRTKRLRNQRTYRTYNAMVIHDPKGDVFVEKDSTGQITFMCPGSINGERLTVIKQENESKINNFRAKGGSREVK